MFCIIDSCAVLHAFQLSLGQDRIFDYLDTYFKVKINPTVHSEILKNWEKSFSKAKIIDANFDSKRMLQKYLKWSSNKLLEEPENDHAEFFKQKLANKIEAGELASSASLRKLVINDSCFPVFLTDDYKAGYELQTVFFKYQLGLHIQTSDLVIFLLVRNDQPKSYAIQCLKDLLALYDRTYKELEENLAKISSPQVKAKLLPYCRSYRFEGLKKQINLIVKDNKQRKELEQICSELEKIQGTKGIQESILRRLRELNEQSW